MEKVVKPENQKYAGKNIAELAAMRNQDPLNAFLDLSLEEDLGTVFWNANNGGDSNAMGEILRSPYVLVGTSDAGAHVQFGADFGYGTILLGLWVRERQVMTLEQAIHAYLPRRVDFWVAGSRSSASRLRGGSGDLQSEHGEFSRA